MNEYKRMAAILLILIFAIADLTLTVLKDFEESGIKRDRRYRADIGDTFAEQEDWNVDPEVTGEAVTDSPENTEETKPDIKKPEAGFIWLSGFSHDAVRNNWPVLPNWKLLIYNVKTAVIDE